MYRVVMYLFIWYESRQQKFTHPGCLACVLLKSTQLTSRRMTSWAPQKIHPWTCSFIPTWREPAWTARFVLDVCHSQRIHETHEKRTFLWNFAENFSACRGLSGDAGGDWILPRDGDAGPHSCSKVGCCCYCWGTGDPLESCAN